MTAFKVDYNEAQDFGAVPDGDYSKKLSFRF